MKRIKIKVSITQIFLLGIYICLHMSNSVICQEIKTYSLESNIPNTGFNVKYQDSCKNVLMINSYHIGYQWTDTLIKEVKNNFLNSDLKIELFIENLDSKRLGTQELWNKKIKNIIDSYPEGFLDVVLTTDDNALQCIINNINDNNLSETPIIFCGVSNYESDLYDKYDNITGIVQKTDSKQTIQLALNLFPKTKNIAVITDNTTTGKVYKKRLTSVLSSRKENIIWLDGSKITYLKLLDEIESLPNDTIALMGIWQKDSLDNYYKMEENYPEISRKCQSPIFGISDMGIGYGILGGHISCAETQARLLSEYAINVMKSPNKGIPDINTNGILSLKFDMQQMQRWSINTQDLPDTTIYINKPQELSKSIVMTIWAGAILLTMLTGLTIALISYFVRFKKITDIHNKHYKQTSLLWDNIPMWCGAISSDGKILMTNETTTDNQASNVANKWNEHADEIIETVRLCIAEQKSQDLHFKNNNKTLHAIFKPVPFDFFNQDAVVCVTNDETEQNKIRQEIFYKNNILNNALKAVKSCHWIWHPVEGKMTIDEHFWLCQGIEPVNNKTEHDISFFWDNIDPIDTQTVKEQLKELADNKNVSCKCECRLSHTGNDIWFLIRANILTRNSSGKPDQISVFMTKINTIKQTELELKEKERQLSIAQEMAKVGYWTSNPATGTITASPEKFKIMDVPYPPDGKCKRSVFRDKIVEIDQWAQEMERLSNPGDSFEMITHVKTNENNYKTIWSKVSLKIDEYKNPVYIGVSQDITEYENLQNELRNREKYLLQAANLAKMFYWHYDVNSKNFVFTNSSAVWGENNIDGIQTVYTIIDRIHPEDRKSCSNALQRAMAGQEPKGSFTYRSMYNGVIKYITTMWEAFFESNGSLESMIGVSMDVTEAKESEKLKISKMEAEAMAKTKSRFLATMSHEIRTPINVVIGMNHLLKETELDDIQRNFNNKIEHAANSLLGIVNDVLDISKIEENKLTIEKIDFSLNDIAFNNASTMAIGAEKKDVEIHVIIDKNLPTRLYGDPLRLSQILTNFISNAVKFTDKGDITINVKPIDKVDNFVTIEFAVKDSGIGIAPENLEKLFDAYTQAEKSTTRKFGGTGLGLAICKQLAELMNGTIRAESEPGKGSTFFITLPFEIPEDAGEQASYKIPELRGKKAIIIDDNQTSRDVISELISTAGFDIKIATNGKEGLKAIEESENGFDLAIIDWAMPEMNGIQTAREIKQKYRGNSPRLIAVTAHNHESIMHQCLSTGFAGFISKPIVPGEMINTIRKAFNLSVLIQETEENVKIIPDLSSRQILIVEDQELNQEILINVLNKTNAKIDIANNGEEALIKVKAVKYDVVLMDIQMPVMDGLTATREIRKLKDCLPGQLPILAMSANAMSDDIENSQKSGMNDHITKPVIPDLLYKKITEHINMTSNDAELSAIVHIDTEAGISHTDGNKDLYLKMLKDFARQCPQQAQDLNYAISESKYTQASEVAHIIKGIAGSIGAKELMTLAAELEHSLEISAEDIEQVCKKVTSEVNMLIDEIHAAFDGNINSDNLSQNIEIPNES